MPEKKDPFEVEDQESDADAAARAERERNIRLGIQPRPEPDPKKGGHKRPMPHDYSGGEPIPRGEIAPKLLGDRAKAIMVMGRVSGFIEKYSKFAQEKFGGAKAGGEKRAELGTTQVRGAPTGLRVGHGTKATTGVGADVRAGEKGNIKGITQMMPKEKVVALVEKLPTMPSSQMMFAVRAIGAYVWRIHATVRDELRKATKEKMKGQGQATSRQLFDPKTGEFYADPKKRVDTEDPAYQAALRAASAEFDQDSTQIKADLNMLAAVSGILKRSGGFGGQADKTFLDKVIRGYINKEGKWQMKSKEIVPRAPEAPLPPELAKHTTWEDPAIAASKSADQPVKAKGPTVRKKQKEPGQMNPVVQSDVSDDEADQALRDLGIADAYTRQFDRFISEILELAGTDYNPRWWDEL
jgi:hypothetical protein